ncbi:MAG: HetP family heterocyst commitment protein [Cyanobacteria bacterium P01_H01_bin.105]
MVFNTERMKASMSEEEFALIIDAILNGKYSWACVLILKNAGYEPGHYIPYRTLNRLIKENGFPSCTPPNLCQNNKSHSRRSHHRSSNQSANPSATKDIRDLAYLELTAHESKKIKGGHFAAWTHLDSRISAMQICPTLGF